MLIQNNLNKFFGMFVVSAACFNFACQPTTGNTATNAAANVNVNPNSNANLVSIGNANSNDSKDAGATAETKEPEQYQATVTLKFEVAGASNIASPPIKADVARNGADRRMEFVLPNGDKLIYVDHDGKQFVIAPNRRQYAELTKDALGFEVRKMLTPAQIVEQVKTLKGVERIGEEKVDGRDAIKYRYGATTNTQTKAGTVATESVILVDKETGLPLRSTTTSQSQDGSVQGVRGLNFITEIGNIRPTAEAALFAEPTDMQKVAPEQIKQQVDAVFSAAMAILGQLMKGAPTNAAPNQ